MKQLNLTSWHITGFLQSRKCAFNNLKHSPHLKNNLFLNPLKDGEIQSMARITCAPAARGWAHPALGQLWILLETGKIIWKSRLFPQKSSKLELHMSEILSIPTEQSPSPAVTGRFSVTNGIPSGGKGADKEIQQLPALGRSQLTPIASRLAVAPRLLCPVT